MNILPKKSWHVRNKDNVARVRRDEAKALEEERECARRRALAEQEARIQILREKSKAAKRAEVEAQWDLPQEPVEDVDPKTPEDAVEHEEHVPLNTAYPPDKHINLFEEFEQKKKSQGVNPEYEREKKKAQEDYEKKIGYLTYLGQSVYDSSGEKPWYEKVPRKGEEVIRVTHLQEETLQAADPLLSMKIYLDKKKQAEDAFHGSKMTKLQEDSSKKIMKLEDRKRGKYANADDRASNYDGERRHKHREKYDRKDKHKDKQGDKHKDKHKDKQGDEHKDKQGHKHKKSKKRRKDCDDDNDDHVSTAGPTIHELRAARQARETAERKRSLDVVAKFQGYFSPAASVIDERDIGYNTVYRKRKT